MDEISYKPIGVIHSPFKEKKSTPRQAIHSHEVCATVEILPEYEEGLKGIENFSHIILLCHFHKRDTETVKVKPPHDDKVRGVFATRSPTRPNPIGLSVVRLLKVRGRKLHIQNVDIIDGTPVLDIKPYIPDIALMEVREDKES